MSHTGRGSTSDQLDRIEAQLAHLTALVQRLLTAIERIVGKAQRDEETIRASEIVSRAPRG